MKLLNPKDIGNEIVKLIATSTKRVILVSPFCHFPEWSELKAVISDAIDRGVKVELFTREPYLHIPNTINWLDEVGVWIYTIKNLHAKLYLNENRAVITSLNLLYYSHKNSLEIGVLIHNSTFVNALYDDFYLPTLSIASSYNYHISLKISIPAFQDLIPSISRQDSNDDNAERI